MDRTANLTKEEVVELLRRAGTGYLTKDAELFRAGNKIIAHHNRRLGVVPVQKEDPESDSR